MTLFTRDGNLKICLVFIALNELSLHLVYVWVGGWMDGWMEFGCLDGWVNGKISQTTFGSSTVQYFFLNGKGFE